MALGATIIEKHFKLDDDKTSIDSHFSANISMIPNFKREIKKIKASLGKDTLEIENSVRSSLTGQTLTMLLRI